VLKLRAAMTHMPDSSTPALPAGFRLGTATAGFQVEGGYDGQGEPAHNRSRREGKVEPSGIALDLRTSSTATSTRRWRRAATGSARPSSGPGASPATAKPDDAAMGDCSILDAAHDRGMQPPVSLHHFTHPARLGVDFWLRPGERSVAR